MTDYYPSEVGLPFLIIKRSRFLNAVGFLNAAPKRSRFRVSLFRTILNNRNVCICVKFFV